MLLVVYYYTTNSMSLSTDAPIHRPAEAAVMMSADTHMRNLLG